MTASPQPFAGVSAGAVDAEGLPTGAKPAALITGANTGIGRVTARELARAGYDVFLAGRSRTRMQSVIDEITALGAGAPGMLQAPQVPTATAATEASRTPGRAEWLALDLADLDSVRACADGFLARGLPLHLLINNAGLAAAGGLTRQGFEIAFGTNHLGHFLLTQRLLPRLTAREGAPARVVTVASRAHTRTAGIDWDAVRRPKRSLTGWPEYAASKLANVLFSAELGRRLAGRGVSTYAVHPGVVATDIWRRVPQPLRWLMTRRMLDAEAGARTTLHCALSPDCAEQTGLYWDRSAPREPSLAGRDMALAAELWQRSEGWVAETAAT
jgi:NAD(P)-dependent dehydrogenase (short-subunit alcohol dehydrogenase family)